MKYNPVTGDVSVNGEVLDEPYINETIDVLEHMGDLTYPQTVPEGCVFVMGEECSNLIVPPDRSRLTNPIVSKGIYRKR